MSMTLISEYPKATIDPKKSILRTGDSLKVKLHGRFAGSTQFADRWSGC